MALPFEGRASRVEIDEHDEDGHEIGEPPFLYSSIGKSQDKSVLRGSSLWIGAVYPIWLSGASQSGIMPSQCPAEDSGRKRLSEDVKDCTRFFVCDLFVGGAILYRRVLGWDDSPLPDWAKDGSTDRGSFEVREIARVSREDVGDGPPIDGRDSLEVRRIVLPVILEATVRIAAASFGVPLPCVLYEFWCNDRDFAEAMERWRSLTPAEREQIREAGWAPPDDGLVGSGFMILPQKEPFLRGTSSIILPEDFEGELALTEVITDGPMVLGTATSKVEPVELGRRRDLGDVAVQTAEPTFRSMSTVVVSEDAPCTPSPTSGPGASTSSIHLELRQGPETISTAHVAAIRHMNIDVRPAGVPRKVTSGHRIGTPEPWKRRSPSLGFSPDARVIHVPPGDASSLETATNLIGGVGQDVRLCDPYPDIEALDRIMPDLRGLRFLTSRENWRKLDEDSKREFSRRGVTVKIEGPRSGSLHDRFVVGEHDAILLGTSLNSLGENHSFITKCDATNRALVERVFDELWKKCEVVR